MKETSLSYASHEPIKSMQIPDHIFSRFSKLIYDQSGIKLNDTKKIMLASRLSKRLRALGIGSYDEYYEYVNSSINSKDEIIKMIDVVSTNKTEFFREGEHFSFMTRESLPSIAGLGGTRRNSAINLLSAGCSSGEEPYTMAIVCAEYFSGVYKRFRIMATDISTRILNTADKAIYPDSAVENVPQNLKYKYFMHGTGSKEGFHRVIPEIRETVTIKRFNLIKDNFQNIPMMDIIFCRNVVIYFDRETQTSLYRQLIRQLRPGGYLFIGHSETLYGVNDDIQRIAPTVYRKF